MPLQSDDMRGAAAEVRCCCRTVGFHDGKNTERLMQMMRADGIV